MRLPCFRLNAAWIFAVALFVRLMVLVDFGHSDYLSPSGGDMQFYADWGKVLATGWHGSHAYYALPGYAMGLGALFRAVGYSPYTVAALQTLSEAAIAALIFSLTLWTFPVKRARVVGALAALGWVFFQPAQAFSLVTMPTTWGVLALWTLVAWSARTESRCPWWPWPAIGLLAGLAATMVATVLGVLVLTAVAAWRNLQRPGPFAAAVALMLAGVLAGTSPCWYHNYVVMKDPVFLSGHSGLNFWIGNNPDANGYPKIPPGLRPTQAGLLRDSILTPEADAGHELKRAEISHYWAAKAREYIRQHPGAWVRLLGLKVCNFWNATQYDDLSLVTPMADEGVLTPGLRFGQVALLGLAGLALTWRRFPRSRWIAGSVLLSMAMLLPVFITERYRLPAVPGLLMLGAGGLAALWEALAGRRWLTAGGWAAVAVAALFITRSPRPGALQARSLDDFNSGRLALEQGDLFTARAKLERAAEAAPDNADILTALGTYWLKMSNPEKARGYYTWALKVNARTPTALNNLAILEMNELHWARALTLLMQVLEIDPDDAKAQELVNCCNLRLQKEVPPEASKTFMPPSGDPRAAPAP
ncbi:MAG: hypothetical protein ACFUZC_18025 [Chthoniobacteraceae bacterium]